MNFWNNKVWLVFVILLTATTYAVLNENFNIYYEDDSWTISNVWNYQELDIEEDLIFLESDAPGRAHVFSKAYNIIGGHFLSLFGWTKANVFILNSGFIFLAALVWWFILQRLPVSKRVANLVALLIPVFPPFFFAAHTGRPDAMTFFLVSLMFLAFIKKRYILAAFILSMAVETHIMGLIGLFYMLAYVLYKRRDYYNNPKEWGPLIIGSSIGGLLGIGYYLGIHWEAFSLKEMIALIGSKADMVSPLNNYMLTYFTDFDWYNHLLEFALLVTTTGLFIKKRLYKGNEFITIFLVVLVISTFLTRRENRNYMLYIFPAFLMMYCYTYEQLKKLPQFVGALVLMFGIYYGSIFYTHRGYNFQQISSKIEQATPKQSLPIVGMPDIWFAAQERIFYPMHTHRDFNRIHLQEFYLVESDFLANRNRVYQPLMDYFFDNYDQELKSEWIAYQNKSMRVWKMTSKNEPRPKFIKQEYLGWRKVVQSFL